MRAPGTTRPSRRTSWRALCGATRSASTSGSANSQRPSPSSPTASTASTSAAKRRWRCARPASMPATWRADTMPGRRSRGRWSFFNDPAAMKRAHQKKEKSMQFHARPISFKPPRLNGLSACLLASHYENNYGGAVRRLNAIRGELSTLDPASAPGLRLNALKREELIATNSMLLHEAYFEALGEAGGGDPTGALAEAIARDFGSLAKWRAEFVAMGKALGGGSGWVVLCRSPRDGTLVNTWAADHTHSLAGGTPILALDMYEHSYHIDFGANPGGYVDAFMANISWERVAARFAGKAFEK